LSDESAQRLGTPSPSSAAPRWACAAAKSAELGLGVPGSLRAPSWGSAFPEA